MGGPEDLVGRPCYEVMHQSSGPATALLNDGREHTAELRELDLIFWCRPPPCAGHHRAKQAEEACAG